MYFVYVLISLKDGKLYVGYSSDIFKRYSEHENGTVRSTKDRRPFKLLYYEAYLTMAEAKRREKYLKGGAGRQQLKKQLELSLKNFGYRFQLRST